MKKIKKPLLLKLIRENSDFIPARKELLKFSSINIINTFFTVVSTIILSSALNNIFLHKSTSLFISSFFIITVSGFGRLLTGLCLTWYSSYYQINKIYALKQSFFIKFIQDRNERDAADISISILSDIEAIHRYIIKFIEGSFRLSLLIPISLTFLLIIKPVIILITLPVLIIEFYLTRILSRYLAAANKEIRENMSETSGFLKDVFMKKVVIILFSAVDYFEGIFQKLSQKKIKCDYKRFMLNRYEWLIINIFSYSGKAILFLYLGFSAIKKNTTPGEILFLLLLLNTLTESFRELFFLYKDSFIFNESSKRLLLEKTPSDESSYKSEIFESLTFKDVCFAYNERAILKKLSFNINSGDFVAITGKTGSGKSTVFKLIAGLLECDDGVIQINNKNKKQKQRLYYAEKQMKMVFQENYLFRMSFKENVFLGREYVDVDHKKGTLNIDDDLFEKQHLFDGELIKISGGEQRKLSILRAWSADPGAVFLMDEPSNGLDKATFLKFIDSMQSKKITLIIFTHENYLIKKADKVISLDS